MSRTDNYKQLRGRKKTLTASLVYVPAIVVMVIAASIIGPSAISRHNDAKMLNRVVLESKADIEGFKYYDPEIKPDISPDEKLYILSNALSNRILPQSDYAALIRLRNNSVNARTQSYALIPDYKNQEAGNQDDWLNRFSGALDGLNKLGVIHWVGEPLLPDYYEISCFSAVNMLEPGQNVSVALFEFSQTPQLSRMTNIPVSCCMDAETNKIYSLSIRTDKEWGSYDPDRIAALWSQYLGLSEPESLPGYDALAEDTPYYKKYAVKGVDGDKTIVTIGFFEGINEFFIKITK